MHCKFSEYFPKFAVHCKFSVSFRTSLGGTTLIKITLSEFRGRLSYCPHKQAGEIGAVVDAEAVGYLFDRQICVDKQALRLQYGFIFDAVGCAQTSHVLDNFVEIDGRHVEPTGIE